MNPELDGMRAIARLMASDGPAEIIFKDGLEYRVEDNPEPGVSRRIAPRETGVAGMEFVRWDPMAARPGAFPEDAPFLPDLTIVTMRGGPIPMATAAFMLEQADSAVFEQLLELGRASGWDDLAMQSELPSFMKAKARQQRRGSMVRLISEYDGGPSGTAIMVTHMAG